MQLRDGLWQANRRNADLEFTMLNAISVFTCSGKHALALRPHWRRRLPPTRKSSLATCSETPGSALRSRPWTASLLLTRPLKPTHFLIACGISTDWTRANLHLQSTGRHSPCLRPIWTLLCCILLLRPLIPTKDMVPIHSIWQFSSQDRPLHFSKQISVGCWTRVFRQVGSAFPKLTFQKPEKTSVWPF